MFYRVETQHQESEESVQQRARTIRIIQFLLLGVFIASFVKLATAPTPWGKTVMQRIAKEAPEVEKPASLTTFFNYLHCENDHPKLLRAKEHGIVGVWYGCAFAAGASFLLLLTVPLWMPRGDQDVPELLDEDEADSENKGETGFGKMLSTGPLFYIFLVLALAAGAWFRVPCLTHSLWNDEEYAMRRFALGGYENGKFEPVEWTDTLFENHNGNNHLLHSLLSRLSLSAWSSVQGAKTEQGQFSEAALRLPSLIAGVLTIALIAVIGWEFGLPWVGVGAGWFFALHPWHIRYSTEAKGYSLCLFFICLALLGLIRAMRHNRPGSWLMFAIGQAGFLLSFAGSIYVAVALNVVALLECLLRRRFRLVGALIAFNLLAAIPVAIWMFPSIPQVLAFIDHDNSPRLAANADWLQDLGSHLVIGFQHSNPDSTEHVGTSWEAMRHKSMDGTSIMGWAVAFLAFLGASVALFENVAGRLAILGLLIAGGLGFWHASVQHHPNLAMYYIYLLIPIGLSCALAAVRMRVMPAVMVLLLVAAFAVGTEKPRSMFVQHDRQPMKQTIAAIRDKKADAITGTFGVSDRQIQSYDPSVALLAKPEDVDALLAKGASEGRPVFIYFAGLKESANRQPELMKRVAQSPDFVPFKELKGLEAMFSYRIYTQPGVR